jgi:circadian clock protein KaiB
VKSSRAKGRRRGSPDLDSILLKSRREHYILKLFVTGSTPRSLQAITQVKAICEEELTGRYTLEVIDVHQEPHLAEKDQIVALPTLLKTLPAPLRKVLGSFSEREKILAVLGVPSKRTRK